MRQAKTFLGGVYDVPRFVEDLALAVRSLRGHACDAQTPTRRTEATFGARAQRDDEVGQQSIGGAEEGQANGERITGGELGLCNV